MPLYPYTDGVAPSASTWNANVRDQVITQCTSGTRPPSPVEGQCIHETDTDRKYVYDGSGWVCYWARGDTYTPTLVGMAIGTGGSAENTATWSFSGGQLVVIGQIVFGTSGATFPGATITASLPSGFTASPTFGGVHSVGDVSFGDVGTNDFDGRCQLASATTVRFMALNVAGTYPTLTATSTTIPFTWVAGDRIRWQVTVQGTF